jgi:hypothetical protein
MKISKIIFACFMSVIVCTLGWSQGQPSQVAFGKQARGILGYLDPQTGAFTARAQTAVANVATTPVIFRLIFNFNIEYNDQSSTNAIACEVDISPVGDSAELLLSEHAVSLSPDGGHSCQVTILASWPLANAATDTISMSYSISSYQTVAGTTIESFRTSLQSLPSIAMLASGQTATEPTISVVI